MKMIKLHCGEEVSERELAAMCIPLDMLPLTPEEREEHKRLQRRIQNSLTDPIENRVALKEDAEFILAVHPVSFRHDGRSPPD